VTGWRKRRGWGGWLALFALGLQLALAFGHHHVGELGLSHAPALTGQAMGAADTPDGDEHGAPGCGICAVIHLAGTLLAPAPPALELPEAFRDGPAFVAGRNALASLSPRLFQARAPPQA